jgi:hypothetical protein
MAHPPHSRQSRFSRLCSHFPPFLTAGTLGGGGAPASGVCFGIFAKVRASVENRFEDVLNASGNDHEE